MRNFGWDACRKGHCEDTAIGGKLFKHHGTVETGLIWLRTESNAGIMRKRNGAFGFHKIYRILRYEKPLLHERDTPQTVKE
jgi:hypothetical protein